MNLYSLEKLEIFTAFFSILTFYFGAKQRMATWPISIVISTANLPLYYYRGLYASFLQNIIYIITSLYGWYAWRYGGKNRTVLRSITPTSLNQAILLSIGVSLYVIVMNPILVRLGATLTFLDALRSALTMAGSWLTSHKKLETYVVWFAVNAISIVIFHQKQMYWFKVKYTCLLFFSIYSYYLWYKQYRAQREATHS